ncbi:MAG: hypothetical protein DRI74_03810 [Bacteroidetes bacterium]|nr:MAG: hypothetical protein DRI74_03810 [Bacteroidota bacterium]
MGFPQDIPKEKNQVEVISPSILIDKLSDKVDETSGLIFYRGSIWTLNDSGGKPQIYRLNSKTGKVVQVVNIKNAKNIDFEDLTQDDDFIYVGDMGNNYGNRKNLCIYKIAKADIPKEGDINLKAELIKFKYADQKRFQKKNRRNDFDCEAIVSMGDKLYLFTKNWVDAKTRVYAAPKKAGDFALEVVDEFNVDGLVTAAEYQAETKTLSLLGYKDFMPFIWVFWDFQGQDFFGGEKRRFNMESIHGAQTEGVCFNGKGDVLISCEQSYFPQRLYSIPLKALRSKDEFLVQCKGNKNLDLSSTFDVDKKIINLKVKGLNKGAYTVEILNEIWRTEKISSFKAKKRNEENIELKAKNLKAGMYYLRVEQKDLLKVNRVYIK